MKMLYAIRHVPTGFFLPAAKGKGGNGGSFVEPVDPDKVSPRFFPKESNAKIALTAWLKGHHVAKWETDWGDDDVFSSSVNTYVADIKVKPVQGRNRDHMEVVAFNLVEVKL